VTHIRPGVEYSIWSVMLVLKMLQILEHWIKNAQPTLILEFFYSTRLRCFVLQRSFPLVFQNGFGLTMENKGLLIKYWECSGLFLTLSSTWRGNHRGERMIEMCTDRVLMIPVVT
jgi:hypothetical protein